MTSLGSLSVIIPVYNQVHHTQRCLNALLTHSSIARELILIDNASSDGTREVLNSMEGAFEARGWVFRVIHNEINQGFGRACNQGIRASQGDYLAILNNDTWLMRGWDQALLLGLRRLRADLIAPYFDESPWLEEEMEARASRFVTRNHGKSARRWVSILMLLPREAIQRLSENSGDPGRLFDERFFVTCEDNDLRERMERSGMRYYQTADCYIWHHSKGTRASLSSDHEKEGLRLFHEKWNFDPRDREKTPASRFMRNWIKWKNKRGLF